ncbi:hypothetical protein [Nitrosopumilus spindle-shaped virus]|uniref:Uncharacterized protein n=1 Tax=Nitrosopumilus spindle-shaped virus TaxID=2508184 RepID=A0A514K340_9VIRU|nr:hypothetical protein [Nitrosopumilus spindle-shaped virus]
MSSELFEDPSLLSANFISSLTDEELLEQLKYFKITAEESKGTTAYFSASKNFENLYSEAQNRKLVSSIPIIDNIQKESLTKPYLPYVVYGVSLFSVLTIIIYLKNKRSK